MQTEPVDHIVCEKCHVEIDLTDLESFTKIACPNCGKQTTVPARLGSFLLLELLGMGGMGGVYIAKDETLGRLVAIKVMLESLGADEEFVTSFRNEAQAIAKLNHPHITQIYSFGQERGQPYIVMELVRGTRLDDLIHEATEPLNQGMIMQMALEVSEGLGAADDAGIIHGDVKPENILFDEKDSVKLVDFGLASSAHSGSEDKAIWGTPYYIAPEKVLRHKPDARSDIYSLGATLYHILTGHPPFEGENPIEVVKARLNTPPPPMKEYREDINEQVERVIMRCLELEPARRYPNYKSLISDLRKVVAEIGVTRVHFTKKAKKNIIIGKKRTTGRTTATTVTGEVFPAQSAPKGKRLVIKKSSGGSLKLRPRTSGEARHEAPPGPTPEELAAKADKHRKAQQKGMLTSLVIILLLAGTAVGVIFFMKAQEDAETRRIWIEVKTLRTTATNATIAASAIVAHMQAWTTESAPLAAQSKQAALSITGNELQLPKRVMPEPDPLPDAAGTNTTATASNSVPAAAVDAVATNAIADLEKVAELAMPAAPPEPIEEAALACMMADAELRSLVQLATDTLTELRQTCAAVHQSALPSEGTPTADTIKAGLTELKAFEKEGATHIKACRSQHQTTLGIKQRKDDERVRAAALLASQEDTARRIAEEQRQQQQLARLTEVEQGTVEGLAQQMVVHMHSRNFQQAVRELKPQLEAFQTEPGKEALQALTDRYRATALMRKTLEQLITEHPVRWGIGSGDSARDVLKADDRGVYISGQIKPIPWHELKTSDLLKLIDNFVVRSKTTRASQKIRLAIGAALFCDSFGGQGKAKADDYVRRAIMLGMREEDITRLLPAYP